MVADFLFSLLRDKKFPQFASASITLDISDLPNCTIENSVFKIFINDGPLIPLAISQNNSSEVIHKITNANSPIPGFDISSAFMNESTLRVISKVVCKNDDIFEAKKVKYFSKHLFSSAKEAQSAKLKQKYNIHLSFYSTWDIQLWTVA